MDANEIFSFWRKYCLSLTPFEQKKLLHRPFDILFFDDKRDVAVYLTRQISQGKKKATSSLCWEEEYYKTPLPEIGDYAVILDYDNTPFCVIEYTDITIKPFDQVDEEFVDLEGEGIHSIKDWRNRYWEYFVAVCDEIGKVPQEDMPVACEQFKVIFQR